MAKQDSAEITSLLERIGVGDRSAEERLAEITYAELRRTAQHLMKFEKNGTLQPSALVNEAYLRLTRNNALGTFPNRAYFFAAAAKSMRRILIEAARRKQSLKAGGEFERLPMDRMLAVFQERSIDIVALDDALDELEELNPQQHQIVQLRWFVGLSVKEVASVLEISVSSVESGWRIARAFLFQSISEGN